MIEQFKSIRFQAATLELIHLANEIIYDLASQGYILTLRQLFYQLVSRDVIRNKQSEYKRLGSILNDARLAGLIDWSAIEDRTRALRGVNHYVDPKDVLLSAAEGFRLDKWANQPNRVEVWVEKDALVSVIEKACTPLDVDFFSCRGYTSQSELYGASKRLMRYAEAGQSVHILHFGDHDPSGIDMTRDVTDRIELFSGGEMSIEVHRIALNIRQVRQYNPPPNPAKQTDSRYADYKRKHGVHCWELDALEPRVIDRLITEEILSLRDDELWDEVVAQETTHRASLAACMTRWSEVEKFLNKPPRPKRTTKKPRK